MHHSDSDEIMRLLRVSTPDELLKLPLTRQLLRGTRVGHRLHLRETMASPPRRLTSHLLSAVIATGKERWLSDDHGAHGTGRLVARVSKQGPVRFYYRHPRDRTGSSKVEPLGLYSHNRRAGYLTLSEARSLADARLAALRNARNRVESQVARVAAAEAIAGPTLSDICAAWIRVLQKRKQPSAYSAKNFFKRFIDSTELGRKPAAAVTTNDLVQRIRRVKEDTTSYNGDRLRTFLHAAFNNAIKSQVDPSKEDLQGSGVAISKNPVSEIPVSDDGPGPGDRSLSIQELKFVWRRLNSTTRAMTGTPARAVRLCILLGGQRGQQLLRVRSNQVDLEEGTIQLFDTKGRRRKPREHLLPLNAAARQEVQALLQIAKVANSDHLFTSRTGGRTTQFTLSALVRNISMQLKKRGEVTATFTFADLRRTCETRMTALGIPQEHRDQIQSHNLGNVTMRHYNRYSYLDEKKAALEKWEHLLQSLLD